MKKSYKPKNDFYANVKELKKSGKLGITRNKKSLTFDIYEKSEGVDGNKSFMVYSLDGSISIQAGIIPDQVFKKNEAYISRICRTNQISGKSAVLFAIDLLRELKCEKVYIKDYSVKNCSDGDNEFELGLFKQLVNCKMWYESYGFKLSNIAISESHSHEESIAKYKNTIHLIQIHPTKTLRQDVEKMRDILCKAAFSFTTEDIIFDERQMCFKDNIVLDSTYANYEIAKIRIIYFFIMVLTECLRFLDTVKAKTFQQLVVKLMEKSCSIYSAFISLFINNELFDWHITPNFSFTYKGKHYEIELISLFKRLSEFGLVFEYEFENKQ